MNLIVPEIGDLLARIQPEFLPFYYRLYQSVARLTPPRFRSGRLPRISAKLAVDQSSAKLDVDHLPDCRSLSELNRVYARIIRTRALEKSSESFYWNTLIRSYTKFEAPKKALHIYIAMLRAGVSPDSHSFSFILKAICLGFTVRTGQELHLAFIKHGLELHEYCESGLINFYAKAGHFEKARQVFDENPDRKVGSWNAIIGGLEQGGHAGQAVEMFKKMMRCGLRPSEVTLVTMASACGALADLELASQLQKCMFQAKSPDNSDASMWNALVDAYTKCGRMDLANQVFLKMERRTVSSWTSMIVGHAVNGRAEEAVELFRCMRDSGVAPNHVTFVGVLTACAHGGLLEEGKRCFALMRDAYGLVPRVQHYGCLVDLLGRANQLEEARGVIEAMPMAANNVVWGSLMDACGKHGNAAIGEWAAEHLQALEPWNDGVYATLSAIYAGKGMSEEVHRVKEMVKKRKRQTRIAFTKTTATAAAG